MSNVSYNSVLHAVRAARSDYALNRDALTSKIESAEAWVNRVAADRAIEISEALSYGELVRSPTSGKLYIRLAGLDRKYQQSHGLTVRVMAEG